MFNVQKIKKSMLVFLIVIFFQSTVVFAASHSGEHVFGYVKTFGLANDTNQFSDIVNDVETDANGNVYQSGAFRLTVDFDPSENVSTQKSGYYVDAYVTKTNADGSYAWTWRSEGYYGAHATSATADELGNVYISGYYNSATDFDPDPLKNVKIRSRYSWDAFYVKLDKDGKLIWVKTLNGNRKEYAKDVAIDKDGNMYVTGYYDATFVDFNPEFYNVDTQHVLGFPTLYVTKINNDGSYGWTHRSGHTSGRTYGLKIEISPQAENVSDLVYIAGYFMGTVDFDANDRDNDGSLHSKVSNGSYDGFLFQLDDQGSFNWLRTIGGVSVDYIRDLHTSNNRVYILGTTIDQTVFGDGTNEEILGTPGGRNVFYSVFEADGSYVQTKMLPSSSPDPNLFLSTDSNENIYVAGVFSRTTDFYSGPDPSLSDIREVNGLSELYISKYTVNGDSIWTKTIAVAGKEALTGMSMTAQGNLYLTGTFSNTVDFNPNTEQEFSKTAFGFRDIYLLLLTQNPGNFISETINPTDATVIIDPDGSLPIRIPGVIQPGLGFFFLKSI